MSNLQIEHLAALTSITITLCHWDEKKYNQEWKTALAAAQGGSPLAFLTHASKVAKAGSTQAQGKGLYLLSKPSQYSPKPKANELMVVECTLTPSLDVSNNPVAGSALHTLGITTKDAMYKQEENGMPPRLLMKYGGYYRLTTVQGVTMTTDLKTVDADILTSWRMELVKLSDRAGFNALKSQAEADGIDVGKW